MVEDLGQLIAQLRRAFAVGGGGHLRQQQDPTLVAIDALRNREQLAPASPMATFLKDNFARSETCKGALATAIDRNRGTNREASPEAEAFLRRVSNGELTASDAFQAVLDLPGAESKRYWVRLLAEAASDPDDRAMLVQIHRNADLVPAQSAARKAMRLIDAVSYGPQVDLN